MLFLTGFGLIVIPISTASACAFLIGNEVLKEVIINKYIKYKKLYEKHQQTIKSFDKFYRKSLQDNIFDKYDYESLCNVSTKYVDAYKNEVFFIIMNIKKLSFLSHNKLIIRRRT